MKLSAVIHHGNANWYIEGEPITELFGVLAGLIVHYVGIDYLDRRGKIVASGRVIDTRRVTELVEYFWEEIEAEFVAKQLH